MKSNFKIPEGSLDSRIRKNVAARQKLKKKWDRHCKYGAEDTSNALDGAVIAIEKYSADEGAENWVRLLDEGVVVEGDGTPYAVIAKGTIKKWYDELPANFNGYINKDHVSGIGLGNFSKADVRLVEIGGDRYGVDVNVKLDHELYAVKDLLRQMNRKALSSEFYYEADEYVKASNVTGDSSYPDWYLIPKITELAIVGYAVVDNPKNANSYDPNLLEKASDGGEERNSMNLEELKKLAAEGDANAAEELQKLMAEESEETEGEENEGADNAAEGEKTEAGAEGADNAEADDKEGEGEEEGEEAAEDKGDEATEEEGDKEEEDGEKFSVDDLVAEVKTLKANFEAVSAENKELKAQLSAQKEAKADLATRLTEVLGLASASDKTESEGAATSEKEKSGADTYVDALRKSFSEI